MVGQAAAADRFVRHRKPDRGTYESPSLAKKNQAPEDAPGGLVDAPLEDALPAVSVERLPAEIMQASFESSAPMPPGLDPSAADRLASPIAAHQVHPDSVGDRSASHHSAVQTCSCPSCTSPSLTTLPQSYAPMVEMGEVTCGCESPGCDGFSCDGGGCDSLGIGGSSRDWFGSLELLLMFRKGDRLPPLVTSTIGDPPDFETAGTRGDADTIALLGDEKLLDGMTAGGRLTIGSWLDRYKDRSVVLRGWFAGEETNGFNTDGDATTVITRPFFDVSDGITPEESTLVVAFPDLARGSISVQADSNVYGADISMRQLWYKGMGGTVDLLYGYQYMGLDESLGISSTSVSLSDDFAPVGSLRTVIDDFDVENDFHGGQLGISTNYREGCWSFRSLAKVGFGSLSRRVTRTGTDFRSIDANNFTDPNGLLIRSTNSGERTDNTFSWVPELDFTLGWQHFPSFDVTVGYHVIALTDAVQVSGTIDPELATNLADVPVGAQRPSPILRDNTFYVQGIHFGLNYIW